MGERRGELFEGPDHRGRYSYALYWMSNYHPGHPDGEYRRAERGQHYFGVPPDNVKDWTDRRRERCTGHPRGARNP